MNISWDRWAEIVQVLIALRPCYEMPDTDPAYGAMGQFAPLRPCYAMPGTDLGCGSTGQKRAGPHLRLARYRYY
eukprot:1338339-Rhodomonas_salina.2